MMVITMLVGIKVKELMIIVVVFTIRDDDKKSWVSVTQRWKNIKTAEVVVD